MARAVLIALLVLYLSSQAAAGLGKPLATDSPTDCARGNSAAQAPGAVPTPPLTGGLSPHLGLYDPSGSSAMAAALVFPVFMLLFLIFGALLAPS